MRRLQASGTPPAWPCEPLERAMEEKADIRGMHLTWWLIVEVLHVPTHGLIVQVRTGREQHSWSDACASGAMMGSLQRVCDVQLPWSKML